MEYSCTIVFDVYLVISINHFEGKVFILSGPHFAILTGTNIHLSAGS